MGAVDMDWKECAAVETVPGKLSGQPVIRHSRVRPEDLVGNRAEGAEWLAANYAIPLKTVQEILTFYDMKSRKRAASHHP